MPAKGCYNGRMLVQMCPRLGRVLAPLELDRFFRSPMYCVLIVALMLIAELFAMELAVFSCWLALLLIGFLFTEETVCGLPIACCAYMSVARCNNPIKNPAGTIFAQPAFLNGFFMILGLALCMVAVKFLFRLIRNKGRVPLPRLLGGLLFLGIAYMLGGAFTEHYSWSTIGFGFGQLVSLALLYVFFTCTVDFKTLPRSYLPMLFTLIGAAMCAEIADMYIASGFFSAETMDRGLLYTGWGVYNNVACVMAMCIPAPAYFAVRARWGGWMFTALTAFYYVMTCFTQSRGGILFGTVVGVTVALYILIATGERRRPHIAVCIAVIALGLVFLYVFRDVFETIFRSMLDKGADPSARDRLYRECWQAFLDAPQFGVGFYDTPGFTFTSAAYHFMPPRSHDTYIQLFASCGVTGVFAYAVHRADTLVLLLKRRSHEKAFVLFSIAALMLTSIVDCNFFNFGPGILYGILLAYAEWEDRRTLYAAHRRGALR